MQTTWIDEPDADVPADVPGDGVPPRPPGAPQVDAGPDTLDTPARHRRLLLAVDVVAVAVGWLVAMTVTGGLGLTAGGMAVAALAAAATVPFLHARRLYQARFCAVRTAEINRLVHAAALASLVVLAADGLLPAPVTPLTAVVGGAASSVLLAVGRGFFGSWVSERRRRGLDRRPVVLVGVNDDTRYVLDLAATHPEFGYEVRGVVGSRAAAADHGLEHLHRGDVDAAMPAVAASGATGAIVVPGALSSGEVTKTVQDLLDGGVHVHVASNLRGIGHQRLVPSPVAHEPLWYVEPTSLARWQVAAKRALDVVLSATALVVLSPVLLAIAAVVKAQDGGPVLFRQQRVGRNGSLFDLVKIRTMVTTAEDMLVEMRDRNQRTGPLFKVRDDPRVTPFGRLLRVSGLDEIPQLLNVLRGEMSLVGPRPALPQEVAEFDERHLVRNAVPPGISGLWQVEARDNPSFESYRRLDLYYVENWSLTLDLIIILRTLEVSAIRVLRVLRPRRAAAVEPSGAAGVLD